MNQSGGGRTNVELLKGILDGLAKLRVRAGFWKDSESEEAERETQAYKTAEALRPFYLGALSTGGADPPLPLKVLQSDTDSVLKLVRKHGFFPSPYSPIPGVSDQYTDFAAFMLCFCADAHDFWSQRREGKTLLRPLREVAQLALSFIRNPAHSLQDDTGIRWAGTDKWSRAKKTREYFTDTCFTAMVVLAINRCMDHPVLALSGSEQDQLRNLIRSAGTWIAARFDGEFITGNETKTNRALLYSTWGARALAETYHHQDRAVKAQVPQIAEAYLRAVRETRLAEEELFRQQEYLTVLSDAVDTLLYYEDRSEFAGILLTLASFRGIAEIERVLDDAGYAFVFERVYNQALALRNPVTGLWYREGPIISIHAFLVEALINLDRRTQIPGRRIEVSGFLVREAVKDVFSDDAVISTLQQAVYDRVLKRAEELQQERAVRDGMRDMAPEAPADGLPKARKGRSVRRRAPETLKGKGRKRKGRGRPGQP